jgi:hypothetical protein
MRAFVMHARCLCDAFVMHACVRGACVRAAGMCACCVRECVMCAYARTVPVFLLRACVPDVHVRA